MEIKKKGPTKGAAKKWSERLKQIGEQVPPEDLMDKLNKVEKLKKIAKPNNITNDLEA